MVANNYDIFEYNKYPKVLFRLLVKIITSYIKKLISDFTKICRKYYFYLCLVIES